MSARLDDERMLTPGELRPMSATALDHVMALEAMVYPFPWSRGNFVDSLAAGYLAWTVHGPDDALLAYSVAMLAADEMHLLNITVAPPVRRRGHARRLLAELEAACRRQRASTLWLEVRRSNVEAQDVYLRLGFATVGVRRGYYPAADGREDALVMSRPVAVEAASSRGGLHAVE